MARTTEERVREIASIKSTVCVVPYIETASVLVDRVASCNSSATSKELELIERYLAAHYAHMAGIPTSVSIASKSIGRASTSYSRVSSPNGRSPFLESAVNLDSSKCLVGIIEGQVSIQWLGTERE